MILKEIKRLKSEHCTDEMIDNLSQDVLPYEDLLIAFQQSEEKKIELKAALKKLTKKQLEIIKLRFFDNLSYAEIALQTSLSQRTVYNLVYEAIRHLRVCLRLLLFYL
jgi:RNA polymerase sigma-70 factor (ECF subfamily)